MFCPRDDSPDIQALSVNVSMKCEQRRSACADSSEQSAPLRLNVYVVKPVHFLLSSRKGWALIRVSEQHLKYFNTLEHLKERCVHIIYFKSSSKSVFCVLTPLTDVSCLEELHFFDSVVTLYQTWCLLLFLCLRALN